MSGRTVADFLGYWANEGEIYARCGDYEWMAGLVPGKRVLEIGCGLGFGTEALTLRGMDVLALDTLDECIVAARQRVAGRGAVSFMQAEVTALDDEQRAGVLAFCPDTVVCWLMGAPASVTGASAHDGGQAVAAYREKIHRAVAELAASLACVRFLHFVDRTAIPWQAKDIGRDTLVRYHLGKTLLGLPFSATRTNALYRKLGDKVVDMATARRTGPALKSVTPTLASLLAERKD